MEIIKQGIVIFEDGRIVEISNFEVKNGTLAELESWVRDHYKYQAD